MGFLDVGFWLKPSCEIGNGLVCLDHTVTYHEPALGDPYNEIKIFIRNEVGYFLIVKEAEFIEPSLEIVTLSGIGYPVPPGQPADDGFGNPDSVTIKNVKKLAGDEPVKSGKRYDAEFILKIENTVTEVESRYPCRISGKID